METEENISSSSAVYCAKNMYTGSLANLWSHENNLLLKYRFIDIFVLRLSVIVFFHQGNELEMPVLQNG